MVPTGLLSVFDILKKYSEPKQISVEGLSEPNEALGFELTKILYFFVKLRLLEQRNYSN